MFIYQSKLNGKKALIVNTSNRPVEGPALAVIEEENEISIKIVLVDGAKGV